MAIRWDDNHETVRRKNLWQLRRTPRGGEIKCYIVSTKPVGVWTHFYGGGTMPCEGDNCVACADHQSARKHWYIAVIGQKDGEKFMLEMTDRGADAIIQVIESKATLRGRYLRTYRINNKPNGPVESITGDLAPSHITIPNEPNLKQCLSIIWGLDSRTDDCEPGEEYTRVAGHRRKRKLNNGPRTEETTELPQPLDAGGLRSADAIHEPTPETGNLPPRAATEPTKPRAEPATPEIRNGQHRVEYVD